MNQESTRNWKLIMGIISYILLCTTNLHGQTRFPTSNLIRNGNFMSADPLKRPLDWVMGRGLQTVSLSGKHKHGKNKDDFSLKIIDTSRWEGVCVRSPKQIADPGAFFQSNAWVIQEKGETANLNLEFWGQNNQLLAKKSVKGIAESGWRRLKVELKAPDSCTHVTVSITTGKADTGVSYWDDVSLVREQSYDPIIPRNQRQLFIDNYRIAKMTDAQQLVHPGTKSGILIHPTEPWEGDDVYIYGTVLHEQPAGSEYRMWYTCYSNNNYYLCYATSKDGIRWIKPHLGIVDFKGNSENNICRIGGGTLVYDPQAEDSARYKLMAFDRKNFGYNVYFSPDGLHWTHYPHPVIAYGDVSNVAFDKERNQFIASTKERMLLSKTAATPGKNDRCAFVSVSDDFIHWHAPGEKLSPYTLAVEGSYQDNLAVRASGGIESDVYGMPVYPYQGTYIGFPWFFNIQDYKTGIYASAGDGIIQPQIAISRDLRKWDRPNNTPIIPIGRSGAWDDGTIYSSSTMEVTDSQMIVYFGAMNLPHGGNVGSLVQRASIGRATWRRDGFVSLYNAGYDPGEVLTQPIIFNGSKLKINARLNSKGTLYAEILDSNSIPLKGYSLREAKPVLGDNYSKTVEWINGNDLSALAGKVIRIRFYLTNGNLYSFWFE